MKTITIRAIDFETCGFAPPAGICEVAILDAIVQITAGGALVKRGTAWASLVHPGQPIPPEASGIHDITDEMVADSMRFVEARAFIVRVPPDAWCGHNITFERQWFDPPEPWVDTWKLATYLWPESPNHQLGTLRYFLNLNVPPEVGPRHRAAADAYLAACILRRAFKAGMSFEDMIAVSAAPLLLPRLTFGEHAMKPIGQVPASYLEWILRPGKREPLSDDVLHTARTELAARFDVPIKTTTQADNPGRPLATDYAGPATGY